MVYRTGADRAARGRGATDPPRTRSKNHAGSFALLYTRRKQPARGKMRVETHFPRSIFMKKNLLKSSMPWTNPLYGPQTASVPGASLVREPTSLSRTSRASAREPVRLRRCFSLAQSNNSACVRSYACAFPISPPPCVTTPTTPAPRRG